MASTHVLYTGGLPACHIHLLSLLPAHRANDQTRRHASFEVHKSSHRPRPASLATSCSPNSSSRFCKAASRAPPACFLRGMPPSRALLMWLAQPTSPVKVHSYSHSGWRACMHTACIAHAASRSHDGKPRRLHAHKAIHQPYLDFSSAGAGRFEAANWTRFAASFS